MNMKFLEKNLGIITLIFVVLTLLLFYTAYDKTTKTLIPQKLVDVVTFKDVSKSLSEINKVLALASIGLIAISFIVGPLSRMFPAQFTQWLTHRKFIGLSGFALALFHAIYSILAIYALDLNKMIFANPKVFGFLSAVIAFAIFLVMAVTSNAKSVKKMGYDKWKMVQTIGYVGLALAVLHFVILEIKPNVGLDVRPYGLVFLVIPLVALVIRIGMIFIKAPQRTKFEHHTGKELLEESETENYLDRK